MPFAFATTDVLATERTTVPIAAATGVLEVPVVADTGTLMGDSPTPDASRDICFAAVILLAVKTFALALALSVFSMARKEVFRVPHVALASPSMEALPNGLFDVILDIGGYDDDNANDVNFLDGVGGFPFDRGSRESLQCVSGFEIGRAHV